MKISKKEKNAVLIHRQLKVIAQETLEDLTARLKKSINAVNDSVRRLEDFMEDQPGLREAIENDFVKVEKLILDLKQVARSFRNLKTKTVPKKSE